MNHEMLSAKFCAFLMKKEHPTSYSPEASKHLFPFGESNFERFADRQRLASHLKPETRNPKP
jgi:hypothetical protein